LLRIQNRALLTVIRSKNKLYQSRQNT